MHLLASSLALLLLATAVDLAQSAKCNNETVTCLPGSRGRCERPPVARGCCSRKLTKCGDCTVCLKYREKGEHCESFAPTNAVCRPPTICGGGLVCV